MSGVPFDTRQTINRAALAAIGSAANATLTTILTDINSIFAAATSAPTASVIMKRDANANTQANSFISNFNTTATSGTTTTLTVASAETQQFTGTTTQTVVLPNATTLYLGQQFYITNRSTGVVTVNANGGGLIQTMSTDTQATFTVTNIGSSAGTWDVSYTSSNALNNPMTTEGDMIYESSGVPARLPIGTEGGVLVSNGTDPEWITAGTAGQVLTSDGGASIPYWSSPSGYTTFSNQTASNVDAYSPTNVTFSTVSNGTTINGVPLMTGMNILLADQTNVAEQGCWVVPATGSPTTRSTFANTFSKLNGIIIYVGTSLAGSAANPTPVTYYQTATLTSFSTPQVWTTSPSTTYSFTVPTNVTRLVVAAAGGGGGGGGAGGTSGNSESGGGGGGGGAQPITVGVTCTSGETITITLGEGGNGGNGSSGNGVAGSTGGNTTLTGSFGTLTFTGALGGGASTENSPSTSGSGAANVYFPTVFQVGGGVGQSGDQLTIEAAAGTTSIYNAGGAAGVSGAVGGAGGGGGAGIGTGGQGGTSGSGAAGWSSSAKNYPGSNGNTSAGGGGGGGTERTLSSSFGAPGGRGGDGYVLISW